MKMIGALGTTSQRCVVTGLLACLVVGFPWLAGAETVRAMVASEEFTLQAVQPEPGGPRRDNPIYDPPPDQEISGIWWIQQYNSQIVPVDGEGLPFTLEGRARYQENIAGLRNGTIIDEARRTCLPDGVPRVLSSPYPFRIILTPGQVTLIYEINRVIRVVPLDQPLPTLDHLETFSFFSGHSAGRWEGNTLVIETTGFKDSTFIDATGVPHSRELRIIERVRKLDAQTLEVIAEISDPPTFTRPWNARFLYSAHPNLELDTYVCGDVHRDISHIPGVAESSIAP